MMHEQIETPTEANEASAATPTAAPRSRNVKLGIGAAVVALVAVTGAIANGNRETKWSDAEAPAAPVKMAAVAPSAPKPVTEDPSSVIRGVIQSQSEAVIASRMTAGITSMPYKVGQKFGRGAMLASFDCSVLRAQLSAANAATVAYRKTYDTNVELDAYQAVGRNEVGVSKANLGKAVAEGNAVSAQLNGCAVYAPFSGTVVEVIAHANEVAATGQPLMKIQDGNNLEVQIIVPSKWLTWLKPGAPFAFAIDETGQTVNGKIARFGASVDPVSKTIRVIGSLVAGGATVLPGMSGSAKFDQPTNNAQVANGKPTGA
jgi:membrane fusion protein, multidrug efflux system